MSAYYGGRCECKIRKKPVKVTVLDFFSMYPTITLLLGLWDYVIADKIQYEEIIRDIDAIQGFIDGFDIHKALDRDSWTLMNVLIEIEPNRDILPIRSKYGDKESYNIGINYVTYKGSLYYFLSDILASKLLTGKSPKIKSAVRFIPEGIQEGLTES